jgi:hypothetical protein
VEITLEEITLENQAAIVLNIEMALIQTLISSAKVLANHGEPHVIQSTLGTTDVTEIGLIAQTVALISSSSLTALRHLQHHRPLLRPPAPPETPVDHVLLLTPDALIPATLTKPGVILDARKESTTFGCALLRIASAETIALTPMPQCIRIIGPSLEEARKQRTSTERSTQSVYQLMRATVCSPTTGETNFLSDAVAIMRTQTDQDAERRQIGKKLATTAQTGECDFALEKKRMTI